MRKKKKNQSVNLHLVAQLAELSAHDLADRASESQRGESRRLLILKIDLRADLKVVPET